MQVMRKTADYNKNNKGVEKMTSKPNVLFFFTDDQRFDTIGALGNQQIKTPHMDALVKQGTAFTHAHIPGGTHGAVCMPSRCMLHTGRTLFHIHDHGSSVPSEHRLMGETFRQHGYRTFGTGKWHNGKEAFARSFTDGGEIFFGGMSDHWNVPAYDFDPTGTYPPSKWIKDPFYTNDISYQHCDHIRAGKHSSELFCECARNWLDEYDRDEPFFMYISFTAPHDPRSMPDEFLHMYDPESIELPENFQEEHFDYGIRAIRDEVLAPYPRTPHEIKRHIAEYYGMITHLDHELGKVINTLKAKGMYDNTIIVFAGDNGLAVGQHGLMGKQSCYEHSVRVPMIFSGPRIPRGRQQETYTYLMDIFPTLCDLTSIPIPETVEGSSLWPALEHDETIREDLYLVYGSLCRGVKDRQYKLVEYRHETLSATQLFDLVHDPMELNNLADEPAYKEIKNRLTARLLTYRDTWDDASHSTGKVFWDSYNQ